MNSSDHDLKAREEAKRLRILSPEQRWKLMQDALNFAEAQAIAQGRLTPAARVAEQDRKNLELQQFAVASTETHLDQSKET